MFELLPHSVLQMSTIFLSIVIEALPFVLLGCLISGALYVFLTPERVQKFLPKNKLLSIAAGCGMGFFFPSCECGIVPIVNQFVKKDVPIYTAFAFMLTAPIINPIVIFSTFIAFGNSFKFALWRILGSFLIALVVGIWLAYFNKTDVLKQKMNTTLEEEPPHEHIHVAHAHTKEESHPRFIHQVAHVFTHGVDEFFDTGRYLVIGALIASAMQTYLPTGWMLTLASTKVLAVLIMLVLAFVLSLCSEADAFIGSSLLSLFGTGPVVGFLVFGPMVDIKNLLMMKRYFSGRFITSLVGIIAVVVFVYAMIV
ncbi:ABC transporter membrane protein [Enterococcus phoeniculicola]|jgi:uncharacterized membrane protein YraQ (UPF0718 family)|uniref:ABC transporter membrane protein n=1 Tax=Enterococcus phoeniculicola ATCC BAA-412 TaxID=1158610 RepID=R3TMK3_9ENTE|nr:permease [Enterococcus phoeniculicola]EOL42278.1 ABC transporter membrane protein [Enterococcus phoeniculicola ATCC BAA-412]EOT79443.1 ABC transporter membrane protein [Enterococcus phoeniculicola ATCC BAA-412]OJG70153.1 ABC transporter membrane protein [Enterococcus phoeniculicola]